MVPLLNEFKEKLLEEGMYPHNVGYALRAIIYFSKYVKSEDMLKISKSDIETYKTYIQDEYRTPQGNKLCEETILFRLYSIGEYFKFLVEKGRMRINPTLGVGLPKNPYTKYIPSEKDIEDMVSRPDPYSYVGIRDRAILILAHTSPLMPPDYGRLNIQDVDLKGKLIRPSNAKYKEEIPIEKRMCEALEKYLKVTRPAFINRAKRHTDKLFLNERGEPIKATNIYPIFWKYRGDKPIDPCSMRHARAITMMQKGADRNEIQASLGHRSPKIARLLKVLASPDLKALRTHYHPIGRS